jgi:hypothetical protein
MNNAFYVYEVLRFKSADSISGGCPTRRAPVHN